VGHDKVVLQDGRRDVGTNAHYFEKERGAE
jgi:hypothetical protein